MVLVGNKSDLENQRKVTYEQGKALADKNGMLFFETSALTGTNVAKIFQDSAQEIINRMKSGMYDMSSDSCGIKQGVAPQNEILTANRDKKSGGGCC